MQGAKGVATNSLSRHEALCNLLKLCCGGFLRDRGGILEKIEDIHRFLETRWYEVGSDPLT